MSNIATAAAAAAVIIAPSMRKTFKAANFATVITGKLSFPDSEIVRPSMVSMDKATAAAAMGAACSPVSFVTGLLHNMASFSHGQKIDGLCLGLPVVAAFAVRHACGLLSLGKGADCKTMKAVTAAAIDAVLALKTKAEQAAEQAKIAADIDGGGLVIVGESVRVTEQAAPVTAAPFVNGAAKAAAAHDALWAAYGDKLAGEKAAALKAAAAPSFIDLFATLAKNHAEQAAAMLPTMAAACGLVVITAEQAAILKAAEQAAAAAAAAPKKSRTKKTA